jgi:hypothetical protein
MKKGIKAFFDMEFTGLHQFTTPVSLGIVYSTGQTFYAEFTDYAEDQIDDWLRDNVIAKLQLNDMEPNSYICEDLTIANGKKVVRGTQEYVAQELDFWHQYIGATEDTKITFWSDCYAYDWVLLNQLFGPKGAMDAPNYVYYIPLDLSTLFAAHHIDPNINREEFATIPADGKKHNALHDAIVIKACYDKLMNSEVSRNYD